MAVKKHLSHTCKNKGFTLIEVLTALAIIALLIFAFTPLIVFSFQQLHDTGVGQKSLYSQKATVEEKLATRNTNTGLPTVTVQTVFKETTHGGTSISAVGPIPVVGTFVSDTGTATGFKVATVYSAIGTGDNKARMRLMPNSIIEDDELLGKEIYIYSEFFTFDDGSAFILRDNKTNNVNTGSSTDVSFSRLNATTYILKLSSAAPSVSAALSPYTVELVGSSYSAKLIVDPPNIIVASANGIYYTSKGVEGGGTSVEAKFIRVKNSSNVDVRIANNVNDMTWDGVVGRYIAVGDAGVFRTLTGGISWINDDIGAGDIYYRSFLGLQDRNTPPNTKRVDLDYNNVPYIGGTYNIQSKGWFGGWNSGSPYGFLVNRHDTSGFLSLFQEENYSVNDIHTITGAGSSFSLAVGSTNGSTNPSYAFVMAKKPGVNSNNWFNTFNYGRNLPVATGVTSGIVINDKGTIDTSDDEERPIYVFCTNNGKLFRAYSVVVHQSSTNTTNWQEITPIPSDGPTQFKDIACSGNKIVAVGNSRYAIVGTISTVGNVDEITWSREAILPSGTPTFNKVMYINDRFFAIGESSSTSSGSGVVYFSTDGGSWTPATFPDTPPKFQTIAGRN